MHRYALVHRGVAVGIKLHGLPTTAGLVRWPLPGVRWRLKPGRPWAECELARRRPGRAVRHGQVRTHPSRPLTLLPGAHTPLTTPDLAAKVTSTGLGRCPSCGPAARVSKGRGRPTGAKHLLRIPRTCVHGLLRALSLARFLCMRLVTSVTCGRSSGWPSFAGVHLILGTLRHVHMCTKARTHTHSCTRVLARSYRFFPCNRQRFGMEGRSLLEINRWVHAGIRR